MCGVCAGRCVLRASRVALCSVPFVLCDVRCPSSQVESADAEWREAGPLWLQGRHQGSCSLHAH
eukprot:3922321-Rhodomonas_salina.1